MKEQGQHYMKHSCFFIGHRETSTAIQPILYHAIEKMIQEEQVLHFYVGKYGYFDQLAGESVCALKAKYQQIKLFLVLPYHPSIRFIDPPHGFDGTFFPEGMEYAHPRHAIMTANRVMVDQCDHLIACVYHTIGNAYKVLEYARKKEERSRIHIINLGNGLLLRNQIANIKE